MEKAKNELDVLINKFAHHLEAIGLENEADRVRAMSEEYEELLSDVVVTGGFNAGKTTMINAMIHKYKGRTYPAPETPVIVKYINGEDDGTVEVHFKDVTRPPEKISYEEFSEEYRLDYKDEFKFKDIDCLVVHTPLPDASIQFVDSPGLQETSSEMLRDEYVMRADAVVMLLNAMYLLDYLCEREFIRSRWAGKQCQNVFFAVNYWNWVTDKESVINRLHEELYAVFADKNGEFDEELFNKRVFYVDAYQSECARCNKPYIVKMGAKRIELTPNDEETGMHELEAELKRFLNLSNKFMFYGRQLKQNLSAKLDIAWEQVHKQIVEFDIVLKELQEKRKTAEEATSLIPEKINEFLPESAKDKGLVGMFEEEIENYNRRLEQIRKNYDDMNNCFYEIRKMLSRMNSNI